MSAAVYRMFDETGDLLYVGCSSCWPQRLQGHASEREKSWWKDVRNVTIEHFPTREDALAAEAAAILAEKPERNIYGPQGIANPAEAVRRATARRRDSKLKRHEDFLAATYDTAGRVGCANCGNRPARLAKATPLDLIPCDICGCRAFARTPVAA